jgi:release factor glutamine methyltransferase
MNAISKIREIKDFLDDHGIESAGREAEILIKHCAGIDTVDIYRDNPIITEHCSDYAERLARRRASREPLAYILGDVEFMNMRLSVGEGVLIPRPETEFMVEQAFETIGKLKREQGNLRFLDLCTGSGCLALAIASKYPASAVYAVDISEAAISFATKNAVMNRIRNTTFFVGDLFEAVKFGNPGALFDLIISNPPYIKSGDLEALQTEIREWEPMNAVDGGKDGLDFYRKLIPDARNYLKINGLLILEIGSDSDKITDMLEDAGFSQIKVLPDYSGYERVVQATWKNLS